jgi:hypothetical protein
MCALLKLVCRSSLMPRVQMYNADGEGGLSKEELRLSIVELLRTAGQQTTAVLVFRFLTSLRAFPVRRRAPVGVRVRSELRAAVGAA